MESFNHVSSMTLADAVEKKIYEYITAHKMTPGDPLPKEEELAKLMNVSRNIVREALSRLRMLGLVETRKKKGMTIAQPDAFIGLEKMVTTGVMSDEYLKDLLDMRIILELGMSDYVFNNKTEKDIKELEAIIAGETSKKITASELNQIEIAFHSKLYEMSGNGVLKRLQNILKPFFQSISKKPRKEVTVSALPEHKDICRVLKNGSAEEFREIMNRHLSVYI